MKFNRLFIPIVITVSVCILAFYLFGIVTSSRNDLYLEEIKGRKALSWVETQNERSLKALKSHPHFEELKNYQLNLLQAKDKLVFAHVQGDGRAYNFWRDEKYKRGLLRRTSLKNYLSGDYKWEEVLDIDALAKKEKENWIYKGGNYHPEGQRVLLSFSRGGKDASVIREFDLIKKKFVKDGFYFPEFRSSASWLSEDEIVVMTDWKTKDSLTNSNFPRILKIVKRGQPTESAVPLFKGEKTDVYITSWILPSEKKGDRVILSRSKDFHSKEFFLRKQDGTIIKIPLPLHTDIQSSFKGDLIIKLRKNWAHKKQHYKSGSLLIVNPDKLIAENSSAIQFLMEPRPEKTLDYAGASKNSIYIKILNNVKSSIVELKPKGAFWKKKQIPLPPFSNTSFVANPREPHVFFTSTGFLDSPKLYYYNDISGQFKQIQQLPARFPPASYKVEQFFAESFDKTKIPYFLVSQKNLKRDAKNPTLLTAYGGFKNSMLPYYDPMQEFAWYRKGGIFVLANIRGGGEYGPAWHQAALKENRQTSFNDFYAVAEDLFRKKITSPRYLGITGTSNGGLLMGVAVTQKPQFFQAVLIGNPLLDMLRYYKLSVGSLWVAEYGDPEDSKMRKFINSYSPYQNIKPNQTYPEVFLFTSSLDDRVHPGHARRFAHKLEKLNQSFYYYENSEGGHSSASNYEQRATLKALKYIYLYKKLME